MPTLRTVTTTTVGSRIRCTEIARPGGDHRQLTFATKARRRESTRFFLL